MSIRTEPCLCLEDPCQECCPHDEHDHGICLDCGSDAPMDRMLAAADRMNDARYDD